MDGCNREEKRRVAVDLWNVWILRFLSSECGPQFNPRDAAEDEYPKCGIRITVATQSQRHN